MGQKRHNQKKFEHIGTIVERVVRQYRPKHDQALIQVWEVWERAVGQAIAENAQPMAMKGDMLLVYVTSSTWLHHIRFLEAQLLENLNAELTEAKVRSIKFKVGAF